MAPKRMLAICLVAVAIAGTGIAARAQEPLGSDKQPPAVRNFTLTEEKVRTFGVYSAVDSPVLESGDTLHIHGEPGDFGWHQRDGAARFTVNVSIDVRKRNGRVVTGKPATIALKHEAAAQPGSFFFSLGLTVKSAVGAYKAHVRLHDPATGQIIERSFPFAVAKERRPPALKTPSNAIATAQEAKPVGTATLPAKPLSCRKYFSQIGATISVPCEP
jgi:hypothetical protein